ncbi:MAG: T9SS type A sorting domain-containing protein [Bacteroidota bacterium]|nr:T9SS type A sorting domain-containing protein [Bacteroidota bacterium]
MKKIYSTVALLAIGVSAIAQSSTKVAASLPAGINVAPNQTPSVIHHSPNSTQAQGDTVFVFDGQYIYDWNSTLPAAFAIQTEDVDNAQVAAALQSSAFGPASDFVFFYDEDPTSPLHYGHPDSVFFGGATSWLNPLGQADNWLEMGPITVPATGGTLKWRHNMPDGSYRDGYEVLINTNSLDFGDFSNPAVFSVADNASSTAGDTVNTPYTVFEQRFADISTYAGQDIYIAFHHNANDMFILYITDVILLEGPASVEAPSANGLTINQNVPNPANGTTMIPFTLVDNSDVLFTVTDLTGKVVYTENLANQSAGLHNVNMSTANLTNGMYFYSFTVNGQTSSRKMTVANN